MYASHPGYVVYQQQTFRGATKQSTLDIHTNIRYVYTKYRNTKTVFYTPLGIPSSGVNMHLALALQCNGHKGWTGQRVGGRAERGEEKKDEMNDEYKYHGPKMFTKGKNKKM